MNILCLINHAGKGGSEKYAASMAQHCVSLGDRIFFIYNEPGPLVARMEALSKDVTPLKLRSPMDFRAAKALAEYCKANSIDLIHTHFARENYICVLSKKLFANKAALIHTCHINTPNNRLWRIMNKFFMGANDRVIAVCGSVKHLLIYNNYPADKIRLVYNGIPYRENVEKSKDPAKPFTFISLTRFSEEKGVFFLLESAKALMEKRSDFALIIAGDGPLFKDAKEFKAQNGLSGVVSLPGYCENAGELLAGADCFINSSSSEALSFAILEAMEAGLPIIATNVGGNPEIVNEKTKSGLLVPYGNTKKMAAAMAAMPDSPDKVKEMAENARRTVKEIFNMDNSIKTTYNIYLEVVRKHTKEAQNDNRR